MSDGGLAQELVPGDPGSCSQLGAVLRHEGARLGERRAALTGSLDELSGWAGPAAGAARSRLARQQLAVGACADALDRAGAEVQRYATGLAEAREQGRRAQQAALHAGLRIVDGKVVEPWGAVASAEAERRRAQLPRVQALVDETVSAGERARAQVRRSAAELTDTLAGQARQLRAVHHA